MTTSPSYFINNPTSGTTYYAPAGYQFRPNSGNSWTAHVRAWSGANGTGSLVVRSLTAINHNVTGNTDTNSSGGSGNAWTASSSSGTNGSNIFTPGGSFSGASIGSLELFADYTGSPVLPSITSFMPEVGGPGTSVTITGSNFSGATSVAFNGTDAASFTIDSNTQITAVVPSGATTGPITVSNPSGESADSADDFTPSTFRVDDSSAWQTANAVWADDSSDWQACKVWVDDGTTWVQIA